MRRAIPTTWQYLLDNLSAAKLKEAHDSGNDKLIAEAERKFRNLAEDECTFEKPYRHPAKPGKYLTTMRCFKRNYLIDRLSFGTTPVFYMIDPAAKTMATPDSLDNTSTPALYYVESTTRWHLVMKRNVNVHEALKMTGWEFKAEEYNVTQFALRNEELKADGYIDIVGPIVQGRLYLTYAAAEKTEQQVASFAASTSEVNLSETLEKDKEATVLGDGVAPLEVKGTEENTAGVGEGVKLETNMVSEGTQLEQLKEDDSAKDKVEETQEEAKADTEKTDAVNQNKQPVQFNKNKNNKR